MLDHLPGPLQRTYVISVYSSGQGGPSLAEYVVSECYGDLFSFDCGSGNRIRINRDFFGVGDDSGVCHYRSGDCIISNPKSNSLIHRFCTGRRACTYYLVERRGCNGYFSNYQQVEYQCVPGIIIILRWILFTIRYVGFCMFESTIKDTPFIPNGVSFIQCSLDPSN